MKKFALPAVLILVALGAYTLLGKGQSPANQQAETGKTGQEESFTGSLFDAVKRGVGMKCTYQADSAQMEALIKGKRYRGKIEVQGVTSEVVMNDTCMWTWVEGQTQGIKTCYDPEEADETLWEAPPETAEMSGETPDVSYNCSPAVITDAELNPPPGIEFMDLEQMMQSGGFPTGY